MKSSPPTKAFSYKYRNLNNLAVSVDRMDISMELQVDDDEFPKFKGETI